MCFDRSAPDSPEGYYAGTTASQVVGSGTNTVTEYAGGTVTGTFHFAGHSLSTGATKTISDGNFSTQVQ